MQRNEQREEKRARQWKSLGMKAMLFIGTGDKRADDTTSLRYNRVGVASILCRVCGKESTGSKYRAKLSGSSAQEMHI